MSPSPSPCRLLALLALFPASTSALSAPTPHTARAPLLRLTPLPRARLLLRQPTQSQRLREEIDDPFAKARLFVWPALFAAAGISTFFAVTTLLAEATGARPAADSSAFNLAVDLAALVGVGLGWRRELAAREARLRRITAGGAMASLRVQLLRAQGRRTVKLAELRAGRDSFDDEACRASHSSAAEALGSIGTRVVIVAATAETLAGSVRGATDRSAALCAADFVLVPVLVDASAAPPKLAPPPPELFAAGAVEHLALPQGMAAWEEVLSAELETALSQDSSAAERGLTLVLKKNGRVGTRRLGCPDWEAMLADVDARRSAGFDTKNI
ncbi:hypothetical protein AB1Y20_016385 [Prymnesium parvum]|uniref:Photosystem I assembly protein Ycf4 n=1 Tax=Prymnesium parvum TaxID=97485 RepID=A0AB34IG28_PRYPA